VIEAEPKTHLSLVLVIGFLDIRMIRQVVNLARAQLGIRKKKVWCELEVLSW
jgi:hypothetical protein